MNTRPAHYECAALPTELFQQFQYLVNKIKSKQLQKKSTFSLYHIFVVCQEVSKKLSKKSKIQLKSKNGCVIIKEICFRPLSNQSQVLWNLNPCEKETLSFSFSCIFSAKKSKKELKLPKRYVIIDLKPPLREKGR